MLANAHRSILQLAAALLVLAGCDSPAVPAASNPVAPDGSAILETASRPDAVRPWHIRATVATTPAPPPAGCVIYFTSVIEGHATHLGAFSGIGSTCLTGVIQPDPDPPFVPAGPPPYFTADFTNPLWTLTASNGDELWLVGDQAVAVISLTDNSLSARGTHRIVGGTGRFAGATGEARVGAVNEDGQGPDDFAGTGWIRFRASDRASH